MGKGKGGGDWGEKRKELLEKVSGSQRLKGETIMTQKQDSEAELQRHTTNRKMSKTRGAQYGKKAYISRSREKDVSSR